MTRRRKILFSLTILLGLVGGWEILARVLNVCDCSPPAPATGTWPEMQADKRYLWRLTPGYQIKSGDGSVTTMSSLGLRDTYEPHPKASNERRILTTGDSSVYGWGVPDGQTYQELLEQMLQARHPDYRIEVINLGVPGYSTVQSLRLLEDVGWAMQPDLVLVSNIFSDCNIDAFQDSKALALVNPEESAAWTVLHHSRTYCALWNGYANHYATSNQERNRVLMPGVPRDTRWLEKVDLFIDLSRVPLDEYLDNIEEMRTQAVAHGAGMALVPLAQEWDVGRWTVPNLPRPTPGQVLPWTPYRAALASYAADHHLELLSMPEVFAASKVPHDKLFRDPIHPSAAGAKVMADALMAWFDAHPEALRLSQ